MFQNIPLGVYYPGKSILHRLQARTKLLLVFWFAVFLTIANKLIWHFEPYIAVVALVLLGIIVSRFPLRQIWLKLRWILLLTLISAIPVLFTTSDKGSTTLYPIGPFTTTYGTLQDILIGYGALVLLYVILCLLPVQATQRFMQHRRIKRLRKWFVLLSIVALITGLLIRSIPTSNTFPVGPFPITNTGVWLEMSLFTVFLVLYTSSLLLTMTTTPIALIEGVTKLLAPLRWFKLPVDDFALMTLIALRFIPTLFEEIEMLVKAQTARGADYTQGSLAERARSMTALFIPLVQSVLRRAGDLATALEARGYEVEGKQTFLHDTAFGLADYLVLGSVLIITLAALVL
jgi:energy-coupling factor transport system permease protein